MYNESVKNKETRVFLEVQRRRGRQYVVMNITY
jgi:hypothetical protein